MTTPQEALPCPFCGKQQTMQVISGQELMGEDQEFWQHSDSFGVVCDASSPDGKGGCGAMGGFRPTEDEAIEAWNTRAALAQQELRQKERPDFMAGYDAGMADAKRMAQQAQPAQASGRTNPGDETGGAVERFGWQTFLGKSPEIVPATNGSFVWYSDYLKLWQSAQQAATKNCPQPAFDKALAYALRTAN